MKFCFYFFQLEILIRNAF